MPGSPAPIAETVTVSAHTPERYRHRVRQALHLRAAARDELDGLRVRGEISVREAGWPAAANSARRHVLIGDAIALPLLPQAHGWVATSGVAQRTLTSTRGEAKTAHEASLAARKRARRRSRC